MLEFAKTENRLHQEARKDKALAAEMESEMEKERNRAALHVAADSMPSAANGSATGEQPTINFHGNAKQALDRAIERHIVEDAQILGLPQKPAFREMIQSAIQYGATTKGNVSYLPPGKKRVRGELLDDCLRDLQSELDSFNDHIQQFGASMVSDAKDSVTKDHLIDYITVTPNGYKFEGTSNVSGVHRTSEWVATDLLERLGQLEESVQTKVDALLLDVSTTKDQQLEDVDRQKAANVVDALNGLGDLARHYVQVVTDTPSVNAKAWTLIESQVDHILANPCSFHCVNLFYKHILQGDKSNRQNPSPPIEAAGDAVLWTKEVEQWFTNKDKPRAELLAECTRRWPSHGPRRMRKYAETRAANAFRVWNRALRLKDALQSVVRVETYKAWERGLKGEEKEKATNIRAHIDDAEAWAELAALVKALTPVYKLLRLVDGYTPTVGKIYYKSLRIQQEFEQLVESSDAPEWAQQVLDYWTDAWGYLHCDLHSLGYVLDPEYHQHSQNCSQGVWSEAINCAHRMLKAAPAACNLDPSQFTIEYGEYQNQRGAYTKAVLASAKGQPAHEWWQQWGRGQPTLRWVAMRALSQTTAASCSEQGWSEYDYVHSRRRNRLSNTIASNLTIGHCSARLSRRFKKFKYEQKFHDHTDSDDADECVSA